PPFFSQNTFKTTNIRNFCFFYFTQGKTICSRFKLGDIAGCQLTDLQEDHPKMLMISSEEDQKQFFALHSTKLHQKSSFSVLGKNIYLPSSPPYNIVVRTKKMVMFF